MGWESEEAFWTEVVASGMQQAKRILKSSFCLFLTRCFNILPLPPNICNILKIVLNLYR